MLVVGARLRSQPWETVINHWHSMTLVVLELSSTSSPGQMPPQGPTGTGLNWTFIQTSLLAVTVGFEVGHPPTCLHIAFIPLPTRAKRQMEISNDLEKEMFPFYVPIEKAKRWFDQTFFFFVMCKDLSNRSGLTSL